MSVFSQFAILCVLAPIIVLSQPVSADYQGGGSGGSCGAVKSDRKAEKFERKEAKAAEKGKSMSLTGWVKEQDGKTVFENDKDKQDWSIANADAVKGHEGHHVKVKAKLNEADHSMNVEKLSMMRKGKQSAEAQQEEKKQ
jgi:hypothetical protein